MIINILDPGLHGIGGHHLEWDRALATELAAQGHEVAVYGHVAMSPETLAAFPDPIRVVPIFRNHAYVNPLRFDPIAGELLGFIDVAVMLTEDLRATTKADLWIWPSLFPAQLYACALLKAGVPVSGCIHAEPDFKSSLGAASWKYALIKASRAGLRLNLGVSGPVLQQQYQTLFGVEQAIPVLPVPVKGYPGSTARTALGTIGFFGGQRTEKGVHLIPALISTLLSDGYRVVLHDSAGSLGSEQVPGLTRIGYVSDLTAEVAKCDLIVLPYDASAYRSRESSIVWDALASAVPVVVPAASAPARRVLAKGAGKLFGAATVDGIRQAISEARADYRQIADAAFSASQTWGETEGVSRLAQALTRGVVR